MEIIAVSNHKGGCGKTTTSINLAYALSKSNKKVLLVDLDPQGHTTLGLNIDPDRLERTTFDLLAPKSQQEIKNIKFNVYPNLDLLPSNMMLAFIEQLLAGKKQREYKLRNLIKKVKKEYDYVVIDTAPSLGLLTINALLAANKVIIPLEPSNYALHGLSKLEETIALIEKKSHHKVKVRYLLTLFNKNSKFSYDFEDTIKWTLCNNLFTTRIYSSDLYKDASTLGLPVMEYDKDHSAITDYQNLAREVVAWSENKEPIFIANLPKKKQLANNNDKIAMLNAENKNIFALKEQYNKKFKYKYTIDTEGKVSSIKLENFEIFEKSFN